MDGRSNANELRDQRDVLVDELSQIIDTETKEYTVYDAITGEDTGAKRYIVTIAGGQNLVDGNYYYARTSNGEIVAGRNYWITYTNGLMAQGSYTFDAEGKMVNAPAAPEQPENPDTPDTPDVPEVNIIMPTPSGSILLFSYDASPF